ncbi:MAG: hypothetical protein ACRDAQ_05495, partial [Cetobacterium sp.]
MLSIIICSMIILMMEELQRMTTNDIDTANQTANDTSNDTILIRPKRAALTRVVPTRGIEEDIISMVEGDSVRFECNPFEKNCQGCNGWEQKGGSAQFGQAYFCQHPCKWGQVKAYTDPAYYGTDARFKVTKKSRFGNNKDGMIVELRDARATDSGKYYCGINRNGKDWYETFGLVVSTPAPKPTKTPAVRTFQPDAPSWDETAWMGAEGAGKRGEKPEVQDAMLRCQGNKACTLALLQKRELEINTSCWLCLQMSHAWKAVPLTVATVSQTNCLIPKQMTEVLKAAADIEKGKIPSRYRTSVCKRNQRYNHTGMLIPPLRVTHVQGDVCVCSQGLKVKAGWSD